MQFEQALTHLKNGGSVRKGGTVYRLAKKGKEGNVYLECGSTLRLDGKPALRSSLYLAEILSGDWEVVQP